MTIQTSTNGESVIPMIKKDNQETGMKRTLEEFLVGKDPSDKKKNTMVEVVDRYRLLGAPVGSEESAEAFLLKKATATRENAIILKKGVPRQADKTLHTKTVYNPAAFLSIGT